MRSRCRAPPTTLKLPWRSYNRMSTECSTSSSTLPRPAEAPPSRPIASSGSSAPIAGKAAPPQRKRSIDSQTFWFWAMAAPALLGFLLFSLGPMFASAYLSLTSYDLVTPPRFVGFDNYAYLMWHDPAFWPSIKVTVIYAVVSVPLGL